MAETRDFLVEIGTEELPPKALKALSAAFCDDIVKQLTNLKFEFGKVERFATPRRLAVRVNGLTERAQDSDVEILGPAVSVAFDAEGKPTKAAEGFARKVERPIEQMDRIGEGKNERLVYRAKVAGGAARGLLGAVVAASLTNLPIPKRMRWGHGTAEFVRPVHWAVLLFGDDVIDAEILGIKSGRESRGHRFHSAGPVVLNSPAEYADKLLSKGHVIADFDLRKAKVGALAEAAAAEAGGQAHIEPDLLDEVTALVEWPVPVLGGFEERFLALPAEVLITTMQANQKYFPVRDPKGGLLPYFITFSNLDSSNLATVRAGNERVVRPRLTDAEFFWNQDRKRTLESRVEELAQITFQKTLGSMLDKSYRVRDLAAAIAERLGEEKALVERAALLAKADLLTNMVGELSELQGIMGRYYAKAEGEPEDIAAAIEEQYLPKASGGPIPETRAGLILALAEKIDTLTGIFSAGLIPTGDNDPYALRRAALGAIRIFIEAELDLNVPELLDLALGRFKHAFDKDQTREQVHNFVLERLRGYFLERDLSPDEFEAVLSVAPASLLDFQRRLQAVREFRRLPEAESLAAANKRIRNILRKAEGENIVANVDDAVLVEPAEKALLEAARAARGDILPLLDERDYTAALRRLAGLRETVDAFFDAVMVMAEDENLRRNRLGLLAIVEGLFIDIADISKLQG